MGYDVEAVFRPLDARKIGTLLEGMSANIGRGQCLKTSARTNGNKSFRADAFSLA